MGGGQVGGLAGTAARQAAAADGGTTGWRHLLEGSQLQALHIVCSRIGIRAAEQSAYGPTLVPHPTLPDPAPTWRHVRSSPVNAPVPAMCIRERTTCGSSGGARGCVQNGCEGSARCAGRSWQLAGTRLLRKRVYRSKRITRRRVGGQPQQSRPTQQRILSTAVFSPPQPALAQRRQQAHLMGVGGCGCNHLGGGRGQDQLVPAG